MPLLNHANQRSSSGLVCIRLSVAYSMNCLTTNTAFVVPRALRNQHCSSKRWSSIVAWMRERTILQTTFPAWRVGWLLCSWLDPACLPVCRLVLWVLYSPSNLLVFCLVTKSDLWFLEGVVFLGVRLLSEFLLHFVPYTGFSVFQHVQGLSWWQPFWIMTAILNLGQISGWPTSLFWGGILQLYQKINTF